MTTQSRPILVDNITFQTKSSGKEMISLQLIIEKDTHTQCGTLDPEIQSILNAIVLLLKYSISSNNRLSSVWSVEQS